MYSIQYVECGLYVAYGVHVACMIRDTGVDTGDRRHSIDFWDSSGNSSGTWDLGLWDSCGFPNSLLVRVSSDFRVLFEVFSSVLR